MRITLPLLLVLAVPTPSLADAITDGSRLTILFGATGAKTEWARDATASSAFKAGYAPNDWLSFYTFTRLGYGARDQRMLTFISVGAQLTYDLGDARPFVRLALAHQHEENVDIVKDNPISAVLGFSKGIHHRGGSEGALGLEIPLYEHDGLEAIWSLEASTIWFFDDNGPNFYVGGTSGLGLNYSL
jgi:hypothetical protein